MRIVAVFLPWEGHVALFVHLCLLPLVGEVGFRMFLPEIAARSCPHVVAMRWEGVTRKPARAAVDVSGRNGIGWIRLPTVVPVLKLSPLLQRCVPPLLIHLPSLSLGLLL